MFNEDPDNGCSRFLRNVGSYLPGEASHLCKKIVVTVRHVDRLDVKDEVKNAKNSWPGNDP
jgi:hypothetical protein